MMPRPDPAGTQPAGTPAADHRPCRHIDISAWGAAEHDAARLFDRISDLAHHLVPADVDLTVGTGLCDCVSAGEPTTSRIWAAAYRHAAEWIGGLTTERDPRMVAASLRGNAARIESGDFTPWADTPEPSTPPAERDADSPAAAGGHPGTLDGPGVLGRALVDTNDVVWRQYGRDDWRCSGSRVRTRAYVESDGAATEVLLVDPARLQAAGRVLDAARQWRSMYSHPWKTAADPVLAAAVDAYDRPTTGGDFYEDDEPAEEVAAAFERAEKGTTRRPGTRVEASGVTLVDQATSTTQPVPESPPPVSPAWAGTCLCEDQEAHDPDCRQGHGPDCGADCWGAFGCPRRHRHGAEPAAYCVQTTDNDMQVFAELPDCPACGGTGKDLPPDWRTGPAEPAPDLGVSTADAEANVGPVAEALRAGSLSMAEPAPEPAGDGPGWQRAEIGYLAALFDRAEITAGREPGEPGDQLRALLADRDRQAQAVADMRAIAEQRFQALEQVSAERDRSARKVVSYQQQRDAARAELATARRDAAAGGEEPPQ